MKQLLKNAIISVLTWEAKKILKKYKPRIVAITGSVGKTSTKDAVAKVLESKFSVRKSQKSYNSELGVPLTIIGADSGWSSPLKWLEVIWKGLVVVFFEKTNYPEILVLEVGADRPGDIKKIRNWLKPDVAIITALSEIPVHVEFFSSPEEIFEEKSELIKNLNSQNWAILNFDDEEIMKMKEKTNAQILTFGLSEGAEVRGKKYQIFLRKKKEAAIPEGTKFTAEHKEEKIPVKILNTFGKHQVSSALAAIAAGIVFEIRLEDAAEALSLYTSPPGRLKLIKGIKETLILDDSYNSSPKALIAALEVLAEIPAPRKIAVLGDMLELGKHTINAHRDIGIILKDKVELLVGVGIRAKFFIEGAIKTGFRKKNILAFPDSFSAADELEKRIKTGDLILIKGSQGMRMEKIVERIMAEPERKRELLARQDLEWKNR